MSKTSHYLCRLVDGSRIVGQQVIEAKDHGEAYHAANDGMGPMECIKRGDPVAWVDVTLIREKSDA